MRLLRNLAVSWGVMAVLACAGEPESQVKTSFVIAGLECGACLYVVQDALTRAPGVSEVEMVQTGENFARVTFDPRKITEHQLAQAVREAPPLHGKPYLASLKLRIPGYPEQQNAAKLQALFSHWKDWVTLAVTDAAKGELVIEFLPLEEDQLVPKPLGWNLRLLADAIQAPAPDGPGLQVEVFE